MRAGLGPATSAGTRPSKSVRFTALPGHALYGNGQARFVQNSAVLENQNHLYDASMVQLLTTQNRTLRSALGHYGGVAPGVRSIAPEMTVYCP